MTRSLAFAYVDQVVYETMLGFYKAYGVEPPPAPASVIEPEPEWSLED